MLKPMTKDPRAEVLAWNNRVKPGDRVIYRSYPGAPPQVRHVQTYAEVLGGHTAVVWLVGYPCCFALSALEPVEKETHEKEAHP